VRRPPRAGLALAAGAVVLVACGGGGGKDHDRPAAPPTDVVTLVAGAPSTWADIRVVAGSRSAPVGAELAARVAPLRAARGLLPNEPLSAYGLDRPPARLEYRRRDASPVVAIQLGAPNFDNHFVYAARAGDRRVYLLANDAVGPVLALVGIDIGPPG
jgi:hypothetical protein